STQPAANAASTAAAPANPSAAAPVATKPAASPATQPAGTPAAPPKIDSSLIGKLEGPQVILDASQYPKTYQEAPALADLVKAGKLPAVKDRIGQDPIVIKPLRDVGKYGGDWRGIFTGPGDWVMGVRSFAGPDRLLFYTYDGKTIVPNIAK